MILAALVRVAAAMLPAYMLSLIYAAALLRCLGFLVIYGPMLALPAAPPTVSPGDPAPPGDHRAAALTRSVDAAF